MKVALYARVSSEKQDVDLSISAQLKSLRDYAARNGYNIVREFIDEAESGKTTARPAFREMISAARRSHPGSASPFGKPRRISAAQTNTLLAEPALTASIAARIAIVPERSELAKSATRMLRGISTAVDMMVAPSFS